MGHILLHEMQVQDNWSTSELSFNTDLILIWLHNTLESKQINHTAYTLCE